MIHYQCELLKLHFVIQQKIMDNKNEKKNKHILNESKETR